MSLSCVGSSFLSAPNNRLLWELPGLPFTEMFGKFEPDFPKLDQQLFINEDHGHVFLGNQADPRFLYSRANYAFTTNQTPKITAELRFLLSFLVDSMLSAGLSPEGAKGLEFGANTTVFADQLVQLGFAMTAVDPVFEDQVPDGISKVAVVPQLIEEFLGSRDADYDLIIARHTLEHIADPLVTLRRLGESLTANGLMFFEVPDFESIVSKLRFDAVFHQHLHYFDLDSITSIASASGLEVVSFRRNQLGSNGGSLLVCLRRFRAKGGGALGYEDRLTSFDDKATRTQSAISRFTRMMAVFSEQIYSHSGDIAVFGAGLMLPTLDYHLNGALGNKAIAVFDDDLEKRGLGYRNVPLTIRTPPEDLRDLLVVVGGLESSRGITKRCFELDAGVILSPLVA
jgi:hypothetical protein